MTIKAVFSNIFGSNTKATADVVDGKEVLIPHVVVEGGAGGGASDGLTDAQLRAAPLVTEPSDKPQVVNTFNTKFCDAFKTLDLTKWAVNAAPGDLVFKDGNAVGASYLTISLDPLTQGTQTTVVTIASYQMALELSALLHTSQGTLGQQISLELISVEPPSPPNPDIAIASIQQAGTTLTITTATPHNLRVGSRIGTRNVPDSRLNHAAIVVATTPSPTQFTVTAGPMGNIPSVSAGPFTTGFVFERSTMAGARNGLSQIFENTNGTQAAFYAKSEGGEPSPIGGTIAGNHMSTSGSRASSQPINAALNYAFRPTTEFRVSLTADRVQFSDVGVDSNGQSASRANINQIIPSPDVEYRIRFRAVNSKALTVPIGQIVRATKTGTTTVTYEMDRPHGLTTADQVVMLGVRNQATAAFPSNNTPTSVVSIVNATTFTAVGAGVAGTATSYGGIIARVNGGQGLQGQVGGNAIQTIARTGNILTVGMQSALSSVLIGDNINIVGARNSVDGATVGVDGAYRVRDIQSSNIFLEPSAPGSAPTGADFTSINCGGYLLRRTDLRVSAVRLFDYERVRVEPLPRPGGDSASAFPVVVQNALFVNSLDNTFYNETTTNLAASATFTGASRDVGIGVSTSHKFSAFNVVAFADQAGTLRIEMSNDNTTWRRASADMAVTAAAPVNASVPINTRYYRAVYVNGATAQGAFMLNTSFTAS